MNDNSISLTIGQRIKAVRKINHLTQKEFGEMLTVSNTYISKLEAGAEKATEMLLKLISYSFSVSLEWLKTGEEPLDHADHVADQTSTNEITGDQTKAGGACMSDSIRNTETIGDRIKAVRQNNQLTQIEFAKRIGISQTHISKIEKEVESPSLSVLILMSTLFSVNLNWLKSGDKPSGGSYISASTETIGDRIKATRDRLSLNLATLAAMITNCCISVTENDIRGFETAEEEPPEIFLILLSYLFKVNIGWLKTGYEKEDDQI